MGDLNSKQVKVDLQVRSFHKNLVKIDIQVKPKI